MKVKRKHNVPVTAPAPAPSRGRPRAFCTEDALDQALDVFWRKGYEGASLPELTRAMGINRPSLYAAFGSKEELFKKVLDRYATGPANYVREALAAPTARAVAERLLRGAIETQTNGRNPRGCLLVHGALAVGESCEPVRKEMVRRRNTADQALRKRFARAIAEGDLPAHVDATALAEYLIIVLRGMAVQASSGAGRKQLERVAQIALQAWPQQAPRRTFSRR